MTLKELRIELVKLQHLWDENLISDQEFDQKAADAAMRCARHLREQIIPPARPE
jgi:hypothetical protein